MEPPERVDGFVGHAVGGGDGARVGQAASDNDVGTFNPCPNDNQVGTFHTPYYEQWSFGIQQSAGLGTIVDVAYVGSVARHLMNGRNINLNCGALHLEGLQECVVAEGVDFGVAFDGDGLIGAALEWEIVDGACGVDAGQGADALED